MYRISCATPPPPQTPHNLGPDSSWGHEMSQGNCDARYRWYTQNQLLYCLIQGTVPPATPRPPPRKTEFFTSDRFAVGRSRTSVGRSLLPWIRENSLCSIVGVEGGGDSKQNVNTYLYKNVIDKLKLIKDWHNYAKDETLISLKKRN